MIKGKQIQTTKRGGILLTLHRELVKPDDVDGKEWSAWVTKQARSYQLEASRPFWMFVWPQLVGNVNLCLHRELPECVMRENCAIWIRIADDIIITVYDEQAAKQRYSSKDFDGPFHPGYFHGLLRIPIDWWNDNIDDMTEDILRLSKVMIAS